MNTGHFGKLPMEVEYFGKLSLVVHSAGGVIYGTLTNVAYVPRVRFNLFSLYGVLPKCNATLDSAGMHLLGGRQRYPTQKKRNEA